MHKGGGEIAFRKLLQQIFARSVPDLQLNGQAGAELDNHVIQQRRTGFEAAMHGGDVHFRQQAAREVGVVVKPEHPVDRIVGMGERTL